MKVAYLMASVSRHATGRFVSVRRLAQTLVEQGAVEVEVLGLEDEYTAEDRAHWAPLRPRSFPARRLGPWRWSPQLASALEGCNADLLHTQELWTYPAVAALRWSARTGKPYLVSLRGMLDAWALRHSRWKKLIAGRLFANRHLRRAACLHAIAEAEIQAARAYGLRNPVCLVPNGADLPPSTPPAAPPRWAGHWPEEGRKVLLFLSRIHPKKGLPNLLSAWQLVKARGAPGSRDWGLVIAGWDEQGHEGRLKRQARALGLEQEVFFSGPLDGEDKAAALCHAAALVLPSFSEGLPMAVLEAWSYGLPVVMTPQCNLPEGFAAGAALRVEAAPEALARGLGELFAMSNAQRRELGARGRALVEHRFCWPRLAEQMRSVYAWVLGGGAAPECVVTT